MEEKRTCSNCGARLRPGARFCSACGAIIRNNIRPETTEPTPEVTPTPVEPAQPKYPRPNEYRQPQQEVYYYEKPNKKQKETKREVPKEPKKPRKAINVELFGEKIHLWNALTAATSLIPLVLGIVILFLNFISATYEGLPIVLSMTDCFDELFGRDYPIFYEITTDVMGLCGNVGLMSILYLAIAGIQVLYNGIMYGRYDKLVLTINTVFSGLLTIVGGLFVVFYSVIMNKCNAAATLTDVSTFAILVLIITVLVLILDILKLTIFYQNKSAELNRPSYLLNLISSLGKKGWLIASGASGAVVLGGIITIVLLATVKSPAIQVWEDYVEAFNNKDEATISECYYPLDSNENQEIQKLYKNEFTKNADVVIEGGEAILGSRTEKYITIFVEGATLRNGAGTTENLNTLKLHFGKVNEQWYLLSKVELTNGGNVIEINKFNYEATSTIVKINDGNFVGFNNIKVSSDDTKEIKKIEFPEEVIKISDGVFAGYDNLETVVFPDDMKLIGNNAFKGCTSLKEVKFSDKIVAVGNNAFEGCTALTQVAFNKKLTTIGNNAFKGCTSLKNVELLNNITTVGTNAFAGCTSVTEIKFSSAINTIEKNTFEGCTSVSKVIIPEGVTTIGENAFAGFAQLEAVVFPQTLKTIGNNAFNGCVSLTEVELIDTIENIGTNVFAGCTSLVKIKFSSKITTITKDTFADCNKISEIIIPEGVTTIGESAFAGFTKLETIVFPQSLTTIEKEAFRGCTSLKQVNFTSGITTLGDNAFDLCTSLKQVILPISITTVGKDVFKRCPGLTIYVYFNEELPAGYDPEWNTSGNTVILEKQWDGNVELPELKHLLTFESNGGEYEFNGGEYFKNGENIKLPTPTKLGYKFAGWYTSPDFNETTKVVGNNLKMNGDTKVYAKWEVNVYQIKYNLDGGTISNLVESYTINDTVVLGEPEKVGYTFVGWVLKGSGSEPVLKVTIQNSTGNLEYTAVYASNFYTITFDANGGTGTDSIDARYMEAVRLTKPTGLVYGGMNLTGWNTEPDGSGTSYKINQEITYTLTGNMTLYAMWSPLLTLDPGTNAKIEGEVPRISKGQSNYKIPVPTTDEYLFFVGWYLGDQQITNENGIGLSRWEFDEKITLTAKWTDTMIKDGVTYYYRGVYPQTRVTDEKTIEALTKKTITDSRGYYELNGSYYAKVKFEDSSDKMYFNDGTRATVGNTYYFKVEKILWKVIDKKSGLVISDKVLDALPFYDNEQDRTYEDYKAGITVRIYPNDFSESNLHKFLNDGKVNRYSLATELTEVNYENKGFLTKSFGLPSGGDSALTASIALKYIKYQITVDNTEASTLVPGNPFSTYDTTGYFFPLSHKEYAETYKAAFTGTKAYATDYAIAMGVTCERTANTSPKASTWWLRSPYYDSSKEALYVNLNGSVGHIAVNNKHIGLRPAFIMNTDAEEKQ